MKNVRSQTEANKIGGSVTNLDKRANSDQTNPRRSESPDRHSAYGAGEPNGGAGKQIPAKYAGLADPAYLTQATPLYNGATEEKIDLSKYE